MPVLTATGAGVRHKRRWLFRDLDISAEAGEILAVTGVPGSGRTTVLLALAERFKLSAGTVAVTGTTALGYVPDVTQPEPVLTVAEHVRERLALLGRPAREAAAVLADGVYGLDPALPGYQLTPLQKHLLGLALAGLAKPALIAVDGVDDGMDSAELARLWDAFAELTADGVTVVVTAREVDPERVTTVVRLSDPQAPTISDDHLAATAASEPAPDAASEVAPDSAHTRETATPAQDKDKNEAEGKAEDENEDPETGTEEKK